jgi:hypothetical protein
MDNLPLLFAITLLVVTVTLVVVGIYITVVLFDLRRTIKRVNTVIDKHPQVASVLKTQITEAMQPVVSESPKKTKKRSYTRTEKPSQFRGV